MTLLYRRHTEREELDNFLLNSQNKTEKKHKITTQKKTKEFLSNIIRAEHPLKGNFET